MPLSYTHVFACDGTGIALNPDSRGYFQFTVVREGVRNNQPVPGLWEPIPQRIPMEHAEDLAKALLMALKWLPLEAEEVKAEDGRHLYWKIKEPDV